MNEKLKTIIADTLGLEMADVNDDASMETIEEWESVAHLNIIMSVEQEFSVSFEPEQVLALTSLAELEKALAGKAA